jgi:cyclophilin family peptidyl-prolyl cis-trans isomerase/HEAT repeat protein
MKFLAVGLIVTSILLQSCNDSTENEYASKVLVNKYENKTLQKIYDLSYERKSDSLSIYLSSENPIFRAEAAKGFASIQDSVALKYLAKSIYDKDAQVRLFTAYAIGQIGSKNALIFLTEALKKDTVSEVRSEILESIGKCANRKFLDFLFAYPPKNSAEEAGKAWGIFRASYNGLLLQNDLSSILDLLRSNNSETRIAAANALARTKNLVLDKELVRLSQIAKNDSLPEVRMAICSALKNISYKADASKILASIILNDPDYRVRVNAIKACKTEYYQSVQREIWASLDDGNSNVSIAAADYFYSNFDPEIEQKYLNKTVTIQNEHAKARLLAGALKNGFDKKKIVEIIKAEYAKSKSDYGKGNLLKAISEKADEILFIEEKMFKGNPVIDSYGMEAVINILDNSYKNNYYKTKVIELFQKALLSQDVALIALSAGALREPKYNLALANETVQYLKKAQELLPIPRDIEAWQEIDKTLKYWGLESGGLKKINPPSINWSSVQQIDKNQLAYIYTNKGKIVTQLVVEDAPASVLNFIELVRKGFYKNKYFHRVVPNFVIQGGCPRGDGYGSTDYTIRSEFAPLHYGTGVMGLASSGKDTESCQFFITHSPTPHLDGRYTIFGAVVSGMDIVSSIDIGDRIDSIVVKKIN